MRARITSPLVLLPMFLAAVQTAMAQANMPVFTDNLVNGFQQGWSYRSTVNFANTSPVHSGSDSISVTLMNTSQGPGALVLENGLPFDTSPFASITFWINGGPTGGQVLRMYANLNHGGQFSFTLPKLQTNTWQQMTIPLSSLGAANKSNFTGIAFQGTTSSTQPIFYVDDVQITAAPAPAVVHVNVDALQTVRAADARWFGINTATWDGNLGNSATLPLVKEGGFLTLRWPGGSTSDAYHWASDTGNNTTFRHLATNIPGGQAFITVNYGSGTSNEAAGWVLNANVTNHAGFKYWEIGNECYGSWENDNHAVKQDPYTYAVQAAGYMAMMRAADPNIHIGMVLVPGEDSYANNTMHPATNPRTGVTHNGWTPVMLATLNSLGVTPDFVIYHYYPQYTQPSTPPPAADSDQILLQISANWANDAADIRQQITDYLGAAGASIELTVTENNSDPSSAFGRQLTSIVNGLYLADSTCQLMKTEFNSYLWWDLRNGHNSTGDFDPTIYGWRTYGDEGIVDGVSGRYPAFYCAKMLQYFVRPGDTVLNATSDYLWLAAYAARKADGALTLMVINKDATTNFTGQIAFSNFVPWSTATVRTYGIPQDNAVKNNDMTPGAQDIMTNTSSASVVFSNSFPPYSMTLFTFSPTAPQLLAQPLSGSGSEFAFTLQGEPNTPYVIQTSGDLSPGSWSPVSTNTTQPDGTLSVTNTIGAQQFWRAVWQP